MVLALQGAEVVWLGVPVGLPFSSRHHHDINTVYIHNPNISSLPILTLRLLVR
jgi:hypothetical protein